MYTARGGFHSVVCIMKTKSVILACPDDDVL